MDNEETTIGSIVPAAPPETLVTLRVLYESQRCRERPAQPLGDRPFAVGRSTTGVELTLTDPRASRKHAVFALHGPAGALVEDLSSNGTFVNGERIAAPAPLVDGDVIRVGDSFLLLRVASTLPPRDAAIPEIQGRHPDMRELRYTISAVAPTDAKVLIVGETGTGKELVARAIHERSRRGGRFVAVNCGAIPEALAESQLFGHVAGAFTGAQKATEGFLRAAEGGTLFLDEIGELPLALQPKLLRALEELRVVPVGSTESVPIDVRLVAATHRELLHEVDEGRFRGDLYARLAGYLVHTTPLRERPEDVLPMLGSLLGEGAPRFAPDLVSALLLHRFRFNVRELKELATQLRIDGAGKERLELALIERRLEKRASGAAPVRAPRSSPKTPAVRPPRPPTPTREEMEGLVRAHGGNVSRIARALGRSRRQVYRYLERFEITVD